MTRLSRYRRREYPVLACYALAAALLLISGCSTVGSDRADTKPAANAVPTDLPRWSAKGKVSFSLGDETEAARFQWRRSDSQTDVVTLSGPFSLRSQIVERRGDTVLWRDGEQVQLLSQLNPDSPVTAALVSLPYESMGSWLLGASADEQEWQVVVTAWQSAPPWSAPAKVTIRSAGMEIKVIISQWEFSPLP